MLIAAYVPWLLSMPACMLYSLQTLQRPHPKQAWLQLQVVILGRHSWPPALVPHMAAKLAARTPFESDAKRTVSTPPFRIRSGNALDSTIPLIDIATHCAPPYKHALPTLEKARSRLPTAVHSRQLMSPQLITVQPLIAFFATHTRPWAAV